MRTLAHLPSCRVVLAVTMLALASFTMTSACDTAYAQRNQQADRGRIAVFTEAGALSAQILADGRRVGFNTAEGRDNPEFVLSVLRWLAGYTPDE